MPDLAKKGHPRRHRTKQDYLEVAARLATDVSAAEASSYALAHVRLADVARTAGVARSGLYQLWPTQRDFWRELALHMATFDEQVPFVTEAAGLAGDDAYDASALLEAMWLYGDRLHHRLRTDVTPLIRAALLSHGSDDDVVRKVARAKRERIDAALPVTIYLAARLGRRFKAGVSAHQLAVAAACLADGFAAMARLLPDTVCGTARVDGADRSLLACGMVALLMGLTVPAVESATAIEPPVGADVIRPPHPVDLNEKNPSERRSTYLQIGSVLARQLPHPVEGSRLDPVVRALGHVQLAAVARAAGVTERALYRVWPGQDELRVDVAVHLLANQVAPEMAAIRGALTEAEQGTGSMTEFAMGAAETILEYMRTNPAIARPLAFYPYLEHAPFRDRVQSVFGPWLADVEASLHDAADRFRVVYDNGVTPRQHAALLFSLRNGASQMLCTNPELLDGPVDLYGRRASVYAAAAAAITAFVTDPTA